MKLQLIDDEVKWVDEQADGMITNTLEVFRPNEYQARKLFKQLKELFESK